MRSTISSLSMKHMIFLVVSFTLYMISLHARSRSLSGIPQIRHTNHVSDLRRICLHRVSTSRSRRSHCRERKFCRPLFFFVTRMKWVSPSFCSTTELMNSQVQTREQKRLLHVVRKRTITICSVYSKQLQRKTCDCSDFYARQKRTTSQTPRVLRSAFINCLQNEPCVCDQNDENLFLNWPSSSHL